MNEAPGTPERLQQQYGLTVLRLSIESTEVLFALSAGGTDHEALLTAPAEELGIPCNTDFAQEGDEGLDEGRFHLPPYLAESIKSFMSELDPPPSALWIGLSTPVGLLAAVPWEPLLQPLLGIPVLRLPYHLYLHRAPQEELDTVVCFSSPAAKPELERDLVDQFTALVPPDLAEFTNFHLFADHAVYGRLLDLKARYGEKYRITVYEPPTENRRGTGANRSSLNPWLCWIQDSLGSSSADVVHFLCHCYRVRDEGCLALAESPVRNDDQGRANLVGPAELAEFLNKVGAWSLALTSPRSNWSSAGMRMLQDSVARLRPGPVLLHDMNHPDSGPGLAAAYRFLYQPGQPAPASAGISLNCHPGRENPDDDGDRDSVLSRFTLAGKLKERLTTAKLPAWVASTQRVLEVSAGDVATELAADPQSGRARARKLVLESLAESADDPDTVS